MAFAMRSLSLIASPTPIDVPDDDAMGFDPNLFQAALNELNEECQCLYWKYTHEGLYYQVWLATTENHDPMPTLDDTWR